MERSAEEWKSAEEKSSPVEKWTGLVGEAGKVAGNPDAPEG